MKRWLFMIITAFLISIILNLEKYFLDQYVDCEYFYHNYYNVQWDSCVLTFLSFLIAFIITLVVVFLETLVAYDTKKRKLFEERYKRDTVYLHEVPGRSSNSTLSPLIIRIKIVCKINNIDYKIIENETVGSPMVELNGLFCNDIFLIEMALKEYFHIPSRSTKEKELSDFFSTLTDNASNWFIPDSEGSYVTFLKTHNKFYNFLSSYFDRVSEPQVENVSNTTENRNGISTTAHQELTEIEELLRTRRGKFMFGNIITSADATIYSQLAELKTYIDSPMLSGIIFEFYPKVLAYMEDVEAATD